MADYVYLLENRLSADQRNALRLIRDVAREAEMILFLTGDAVRDLTSGHAVRDLEVAIYGNALKLKKPLAKAGAHVWGEDEASRSLYLCFPGTVRVDLVSTHSVEYKKPGQPTYHWASIQEDLRRRDFTVNAMAISLNEGSYGLLMDPLNGVADIEARALRLVSNYGFLDEPALLIRATRYKTRLGWELDPRTQQRFENAKNDGLIESLSATERSRELEQIGHEDDGLKVLQAHEAEGWMKVLCPAWTPAKADTEKLHTLHDLSVELLMQGVHADMSAAQMQLLTAKLAPKDLASVKKLMLRPGFVEEWNSLDAIAAGFQKALMTRENQQPSSAFKLFTSYDPEAVLWLGFTSKDKGVKERYNDFLKVWPEMKQKVPFALMQEMRIRPELANYNEIVHQVFLQLIDGKLTTPEEMKAFLEPYSPPAPPPQVTVKRPRGRRAEPKIKETFEEEEEESESDGDEDLEDMGDDEDDIGLAAPKLVMGGDGEDEEPIEIQSADDEVEEEEDDADEEDEEEPAAGRRKGSKAAKAAPASKPAAKSAAGKAPAKSAPEEKASAKTAAPRGAHAAKPAPHAKPAPAVKVAAKPAKAAVPVKHPPVKAAAPAKKPAGKPAAPVKKAVLKPHTKAAHKSVPKAAAVKPAKAKAKPAPKAPAKAKPRTAPKPAPKKAGKKK